MQYQSSFFHVSIENFYTTSDCDGCDKYEVCNWHICLFCICNELQWLLELCQAAFICIDSNPQ